MRGLLIFSVISLILLAGCTGQVGKTETIKDKTLTETKEPQQLTKPQVTSTEGATQETKITEGTTVQVTQATNASGPKTYNVNIVQGIGVREGSG